MEAVKGILSEALGGGEKNDPESDQKVDPTQGPPPPGPGMYSEDQIKEGKAIFAKECETPDEYENIIRILLGENEEKPTGKKGEGEGVVPGGNSAGTSRENFTTALNVYTARARNFSIPIKEKAKEMGSGQFPSSQTEFSIGDPISSLNPYATPGIYPGLSVRMVYKGQRTFSGSSDTPDCILVIDNSGSMTDPNRLVSLATLTTTVIANAYLANGSQVAGYSFGGGNHVLPFTSNREDIHRSARRYTGGGTIFNSSYVEALIEGRSSVDIAVLSDMDIDNLSHFVSYISELPQTNRIHLLSIKDNRCYDDQYRRSLNHRFENNPNVVVRLIESQDDIGSVTMGDLSESFGM